MKSYCADTALSAYPSSVLSLNTALIPRSRGKSYRARPGVPLPRMDIQMTRAMTRITGGDLPAASWEEEFTHTELRFYVGVKYAVPRPAQVKVLRQHVDTEYGQITRPEPERFTLAWTLQGSRVHRTGDWLTVTSKDPAVSSVTLLVTSPAGACVGEKTALSDYVKSYLQASAGENDYHPLSIRKLDNGRVYLDIETDQDFGDNK